MCWAGIWDGARLAKSEVLPYTRVTRGAKPCGEREHLGLVDWRNEMDPVPCTTPSANQDCQNPMIDRP